MYILNTRPGRAQFPRVIVGTRLCLLGAISGRTQSVPGLLRVGEKKNEYFLGPGRLGDNILPLHFGSGTFFCARAMLYSEVCYLVL